MESTRRRFLLGAAAVGSVSIRRSADGAPAPTGQPQPSANQGAASTGNVFEYRRNWGRWGEDDQMGAVNLITPAEARRCGRRWSRPDARCR